ncbi:MAG: anthranilate synthase component [Candidatus Sumerlaeota bacterium]|nr:anthranilate synthase component [Candidatus Sumerlaeota bacterium]
MILVIDNYDSFTYNLVQYLGELGETLHVVRNDKLDMATLDKLSPQAIVISPGPGTPNDAGISCQVLREVSSRVPTLGVCLGHQCIGQVFGGVVTNAPRLMHGKTSMIRHDDKGVFAGLPNPFEATRYHSLIVKEEGLPEDVEVTAYATDDNMVMGLRHKTLPIHGVQFHPESILTGEGKRLLRNFLDLAKAS